MPPRTRPWVVEAACRGIDPREAERVFFPSRGEDVKEAKQVCSQCPVSAECLAYAVANGEIHGIWGGMSERERRKLRTLIRRETRLRVIGPHHPIEDEEFVLAWLRRNAA